MSAHRKTIDAQNAASLSSRSAEAGKPVVKGLEWRTNGDRHDAGSIVGRYTIEGRDPGYGLLVPAPVAVRLFIDLEAAKAAAQADYEARVRSALSTPADIEPQRIEAIAKIIFEAMRLAAKEAGLDAPAWVERGNSNMQDEARRAARSIPLYVAPVADSEPVSVPYGQRPDNLVATDTGMLVNGHYIYALEVALSVARIAAAPQPNPSAVDVDAVIERLTEALRSADEWMSCVEYHLQNGSPFKRDREEIRAALAAQGDRP